MTLFPHIKRQAILVLLKSSLIEEGKIKIVLYI